MYVKSQKGGLEAVIELMLYNVIRRPFSNDYHDIVLNLLKRFTQLSKRR